MESGIIASIYMERKVQFDVYAPPVPLSPDVQLLLFNDGQDLRTMNFSPLYNHLTSSPAIKPLLVVGIHAGKRRRHEYGVAGRPDYEGRGAGAAKYTAFILQELLPYLERNYKIGSNTDKAFAGFSLGGLSALDMVWQHPEVFSKAGVFSGSLWWRSKGLLNGYDEHKDRIMHHLIREQPGDPKLKFFFECGTEDERHDRNQNGIIDSIDDTLDLILLLKEKGYRYPGDISYLEIAGGRHNQATWRQALPAFLHWGWGANT